MVRQTLGSESLLGALSVLASAFAADAPPLHPPQPHRVKLTADKAPLSKVLDDVFKQTGFRVEDRLGDADRTVTVTRPDSAFWPALDEIAARAGASVTVFPK